MPFRAANRMTFCSAGLGVTASTVKLETTI